MFPAPSVIRFPKAGFSLCALIIALGAATPASAQWLNASGKITNTEVSQATNYAFRIYVKENGVDQLSTCNASFASINTNDDNYQVKVAALLSAASQSKLVGISYIKNAAGWCTMTDVRVQFQ